MSEEKQKTVAVITTTIGRPELEKAIISIQKQTYPCQHYVFVDGKQYWDNVKHLEEKYPNVIFTFLPMNTGGKNNIGNGAIHAILPYLLQEDIFCFLDDDNWHDPEHIEYLVKMITAYDLDYAYSLRYFYDDNYNYLCEDNFNSLGFWTIKLTEYLDGKEVKTNLTLSDEVLIDTNSYALTRNIAFQLSSQWYIGRANDRAVFKKLLKLKAKGGFTGKRTTHYKFIPIMMNPKITREESYQWVKKIAIKADKYKEQYSKPVTYIDGVLKEVDIKL